jgi:hypothetical protein
MWQPKRLSAAQLEARRMAAAREFPRCRARRVNQSAIARTVGVIRQTVSRWYVAWQQGARACASDRTPVARPTSIGPSGSASPKFWRAAPCLGAVHGAVTASPTDSEPVSSEKSVTCHYLQNSRGGTRTRDPGIMSSFADC